MTSAPKSASRVALSGPASMVAASSTLKPSSIRATACLPFGWSPSTGAMLHGERGVWSCRALLGDVRPPLSEVGRALLHEGSGAFGLLAGLEEVRVHQLEDVH